MLTDKQIYFPTISTSDAPKRHISLRYCLQDFFPINWHLSKVIVSSESRNEKALMNCK